MIVKVSYFIGLQPFARVIAGNNRSTTKVIPGNNSSVASPIITGEQRSVITSEVITCFNCSAVT